MAKPHNYNDFPNNVFKPKKIEINGDQYTLYAFRFRGLYDIYNYLKKDPRINKDVWSSNSYLASIESDTDFHGIPYEKAVEDLIAPVDEEYRHFLKIEKAFDAKKGPTHKYENVRTIAAGKINVPAYVAGSPLCYETSKVIKKPKFITMNVTLSYNCNTSERQVFNRAVIITSLITALEQAGYTVNVNAFELDVKSDELYYMIFELKKSATNTNYLALYKSLCKIEFLRRISFRVLETADVENDWKNGYGRACSREFSECVLKLDSNDIYFDQPSEMNIRGRNLVDDFESSLRYLELDNLFDIEKATSDFSKKLKRL